MIHDVTSIMPETTWQAITPKLFSVFWCLSLYDIFVPRDSYDVEVTRAKGRLEALQRRDDPNMSTKKRSIEIARTEDNIKKLKEEERAQVGNHVATKMALVQMKEELIGDDLNLNLTIGVFLQTCIIPRMLFSAEDALYCAKFVRMLHDNDTPRFSTLSYFDKILKMVTPCIFCLTEREASNFAIFLKETLSLLCRWYDSKQAYGSEGAKRSGFATNFLDKSSAKATHKEFVKIFDLWNISMARVFMNALASKDYMHVRSALIVLSSIIKDFPRTYKAAKILSTRVEKLCAESEERQDLKNMAKRCKALLDKKMREGKVTGAPNAAGSSASEKGSALNAKAKTFTPKRRLRLRLGVMRELLLLQGVPQKQKATEIVVNRKATTGVGVSLMSVTGIDESLMLAIGTEESLMARIGLGERQMLMIG